MNQLHYITEICEGISQVFVSEILKVLLLSFTLLEQVPSALKLLSSALYITDCFDVCHSIAHGVKLLSLCL